MVISRLKHYPNVCRLCFKLPDLTTDTMVSIHTSDDLFHGTVEDHISSLTFDANEKSQLFPQQICQPCLERLRLHAKYLNNVMNISLLMYAIAELKHARNRIPLEGLFRMKGDFMQKLFEELQLDYGVETCAADVINEILEHERDPDVNLTTNTKSNTNNLNDLASDSVTIIVDQIPLVEVNELRENYRVIYPEVDQSKPNSSDLEDLGNATIFLNEIALGEENQLASDQSPSILEKTIVDRGHAEEAVDSCINPNSTLNKDFLGCAININEIALGEEIELADALSKSPQKRRRGRPRKEIKTLCCRMANCTAVFHDKKAYDHHRWTAHKTFVCEECGLKWASKPGLDNHRARHKNEEEFQCEYCKRLYNVKEDLNHHIKKIHLAREKFRCETCGLEFKHKITFDAHKLTHKDEFGFPCTQCDKKFKARRLMHAHKYRVHKAPSHICDECGKAFRSRFVLLDHIEIIHGIQMRFTCDVCVEVFDDKDQLSVHKSRHRSPSQMECGTCLLVFNSKDQMFNHLCITYRKDYICCGKDHGHHKTYNKHQLVKHGVRVNVRVKPKSKELAGKLRAKRKRLETCLKCEKVFPNRQAKQRHEDKCGTDSGEDS
ncbi:zinc finger protein 3 homolog [Culex pipiens pallens]|uniref:zinc finger protein 3 homolog n=1 Tax=Culex pipiens pallens TaxID=42434 RepID=UPI0019538A99|nr:zinc finger protein 3 homolog [Culex pipiens pallens]